MIVCVCNAVRERQIRELVAQSDTRVRMRDLREQLGVCGDCGKCARRARGILRDCADRAGQPVAGHAPAGGFAGIPVTAGSMAAGACAAT
ncbi:(2Fe-2S)-binding protein [Thioalkalivibrio sp. ALE23]|uniref:(2Fe-2S)-binding protein n=1 Tax=Thioalkalivibrio sp. ALE23 TaxID=1265495 RepID=UPI000366E497|nr:(2Fe-2S)-binding protein [Thioalkalivibrio sp. ALE23]